MNEQTNDNRFDTLSAEQKHYVQLLANKKRLYNAHKSLNDTVQTALSLSDREQAFTLAQQVSNAAKQVQDTANYLAHQQKQIEQQHPEFKAQAKSFAQNRDAQHQKQVIQKQAVQKQNTQQQF
jgi:hypothetical protein